MKKKLLLLLCLFSILFIFTGCYELKGGLSFNEDGEAFALVEIAADEIMGGEEARILAWQIEFLFPEIDLNYEKHMEIKTVSYQNYQLIEFTGNEKVDISDSCYFEFTKRNDNSFEFTADIPSIIDDPSEETKDDVVLTFFVEMPADIDMANSTRVEGNYVEWQLTKADLTTDTQLRVFTR